MLGQLAGDALGGLVEFRPKSEIRHEYPEGVRELKDGGTWGTIAGQPTDDSEMALMLARMLVKEGRYDASTAREAYVYWLNSHPFDCGSTISSALRGHLSPDSQANGALMRISPLGIFGANHDRKQVAEWARLDASLTHIHPVCQEANALFAMAIAHAVHDGPSPVELYQQILAWAEEMKAPDALAKAVRGSASQRPRDYARSQGWVLIAFQNALWQLLHAENLEEGVVDTVMQGGDTDTNAAICGALLGAVHRLEAIPAQWAETLANCRPAAGRRGIQHPRPECFWPVDALDLAEKLLAKGGADGF
jgi:ADP-ribosylglycohydrolase